MSKKTKEVLPLYKNSTKPVELRVKDLLKRMTVEEKVYQLGSYWESEILDNGKFSPEKVEKLLGKHNIGSICALIRNFDLEEGIKILNEVQKIAINKTRLGIPVLMHEECLHGCMAKNCTSFPQAIGLACTWDIDLMERVGTAIGKETSARGIFHALSPTINIARDVRCGRTDETYGEDPYLTSRMAVAYIKSMQAQRVICTPKHFAVNFSADGGRDSNAAEVPERVLREIYFPAFKSAITEAKALSIMAAYNSLNGIPCTANRWLLTDILRGEWGFKGFVVSDYGSVDGIYEKHRIALTPEETAKKALEAGNDVELPSINYYKHIIGLVKKGKISMKTLDNAVSRVLYAKFIMGLFESPYGNVEFAKKINNCQEHKKLALEAARKSIVLLKNDGVLPLPKNLKKIAVIGPNANQVQLGGYSGINDFVITPLEGIKKKLESRTDVLFAEGCSLKGLSKDGFSEAIRIADSSDAVIVVAGNSSGWSDEKNTEGEDRDRCNLNLPGVQEDLIKEISMTGKPVIVVLINGSAVTMLNWINSVNAVVEAWYPGQEGGNAIADVLFGDYNPSGKLVITFPKVTGQLPLYYNYKPSGRRYDYVDMRGEQALFPFGFGLSYTEYKYSNLKIKVSRKDIKINVDIKNTGNFAGEEVIMLFIRDEISSLVRPLKELKRFKKIHLNPGEEKTVEFTMIREDLSFVNEKMKYVFEPGYFEFSVGNPGNFLTDRVYIS